MVILCDGMIRSGSTWSFNVALRLLRESDPNRRTFGTYDENPAVLRAAVRPRLSNVVVKSHALDPSFRELCRTGAVKAIYTWRDPYDVVVSCFRIFGFSVEHWISQLQYALRVWSFHRETNSACIVSYETIVTRPAAGIAGIAGYLDLPVPPQSLNEIAEALSFENVKRLGSQVNQGDPRRLIRKDGYIYDRETLLHQDHIRNGGIGYGAQSLNKIQLAAIDTILKEEGFAFLSGTQASMPRKSRLASLRRKLTAPWSFAKGLIGVRGRS